MNIQFGLKYKVVEGSGLDSNRVGTAKPYIGLAAKVIRERYEAPTGRYKPFDSAKEVVLLDENGEYFTMFKDRLDPIDQRNIH